MSHRRNRENVNGNDIERERDATGNTSLTTYLLGIKLHDRADRVFFAAKAHKPRDNVFDETNRHGANDVKGNTRDDMPSDVARYSWLMPSE